MCSSYVCLCMCLFLHLNSWAQGVLLLEEQPVPGKPRCEGGSPALHPPFRAWRTEPWAPPSASRATGAHSLWLAGPDTACLIGWRFQEPNNKHTFWKRRERLLSRGSKENKTWLVATPDTAGGHLGDRGLGLPAGTWGAPLHVQSRCAAACGLGPLPGHRGPNPMAMPGQAGLGAGAWLSPGLHQPNSRGRRKEEQGLRGPSGEMGCGLGPSGQGWGHLNRGGPAGPGGTELPLPMASASASGAHSPEQLIRGASALVSPPGPGADAGEGPCPARGVGGLLPGPCLAEGWRPADGGGPAWALQASQGTVRGDMPWETAVYPANLGPARERQGGLCSRQALCALGFDHFPFRMPAAGLTPGPTQLWALG